MQGLSRGMAKTKRGGGKYIDHYVESAWQFWLARAMQIAGFPIIGVIAWSMWSSVEAMKDTVAEIKTAVAVLERQNVNDGQGRYTSDKALADFAVRDGRLTGIDLRIADHEKRLDALERHQAATEALRGSTK